MWPSDAHFDGIWPAVGQLPFERILVRFGESDASASTGASVNPLLYIDAEVGRPLELFRCHELNAHRFRAVGDGFFKLKISGPGDRGISQLFQHGVQLQGFCSQRNNVQDEIYLFGAARVFDRELDGLRAGDDKVVRRRSQRGKQFEQVRSLRLVNHAAPQRGSIVLLNR